MAPRASLPGEFVLDAVVVDPRVALRRLSRERARDGHFVTPEAFDEDAAARAEQQGPHVALRWVVNPVLGIPLEPFTVSRRPVAAREPATDIDGWRQVGHDTFAWDGVTEYLQIVLDVSSSATATGLSRADHGAVATATAVGAGTLVLEGGPMVGVRIDSPWAVTRARGLSVTAMANGDGWEPIEIVGLPFGDGLRGTTYYGPGDQGEVGAPTDPVSAAVQRLKRWGPAIGWRPLAGVDPWELPDPSQLVEELQRDVLGGLAEVLQACPPPGVAAQLTKEVVHKLPALVQLIGLKSHPLNGPGDNQRSELRARPLQNVSTAVACDTWSSLALGFGTGAEVGEVTGDDRDRGIDDFMVTAPWHGVMTRLVNPPWPGGWLLPPQPKVISEDLERELVAVVLSPRPRPAPAAPSAVEPRFAFVEGVPELDERFRCATSIRTARPPVLPAQPRVSGFGLARFDAPGVGRYALRRHALAGGWIPVGSSTAVRQLGQTPDPALLPNTAMLRDNGVEMPFSGGALQYEYAIAATDLFGQWSPWSTGWCAIGPPPLQVPAVPSVRVAVAAGPGGMDPCRLTVTTEVSWDRRERSCDTLRIAVDVFDPPAGVIGRPPENPAFTLATRVIGLGTDGAPQSIPAGVTVTEIDERGEPIAAGVAPDPSERRLRVVIADLDVVYGGAAEKAVAVYAQAHETVRPGEWSAWGHTRESAIAPNPLPPAPPLILPVEYPAWASLPDAAGVSYASVTWTPTGAWRYRVYEATEAALRAASGQPGPVLTDGFGVRMQALFDLYKSGANLPKLKSSFRKLGDEPVSPPVQPDGTMRFDALLPRGSGLIHCFVVAAVTPSNVVSGWPAPDGDGRGAFLAYAIPHPLRPALPELRVTIGPAGAPVVDVHVGGAVPATAIRLLRAPNALLARQPGTMQPLAEVATAPAKWADTTFTDAGAPHSWSRLQYRAIAVTTDDRDRAGIAVASPASRAYALLNPPPAAPVLALTVDVAGSTAAISVIRIDTDALRTATEVGDFMLAWTAAAPGATAQRGATPVRAIAEFDSVDELVAAPEPLGYAAGALHLTVARVTGATVAVGMDVTDPLGRSTHATADVPGEPPDPAPVISGFAVSRVIGSTHVELDINVPLPPNPARDWTLTLSTQPTIGLVPPLRRTFAVSAIRVIASLAELPGPVLIPDQVAVGRLDGTGHVALWIRSARPLRVHVRVSNSMGETASTGKELR